MTFFNKNQEVIDVQLTRFGKNLLSRGAFKPMYYQMFDDDIIYSTSRIGMTEEQNESETRIKDGIRLRTQYTVVQLEKSFKYQQELIKEGKRGTFLKLRRQADPLERDKLLKYSLANCLGGSQQAPRFLLKSLEAPISGSSLKYPNPEENGIYKNHPEFTIKPTYRYTIDRSNIQEPGDIVIDSESFIDVTKDKIVFLDNSSITREAENLVIDLQEFATSYGLDNFEVEFYEETAPGSEEYVLMLDEAEIYSLFNIETDESVEGVKPHPDKSRNFYSE
jgi:hypothetical protein